MHRLVRMKREVLGPNEENNYHSFWTLCVINFSIAKCIMLFSLQRLSCTRKMYLFILLYGSFHQSFGFQHVWVLAMDHVANLSSMISIELRYRKPRNMSLHGDRLCQSVLHSGYCSLVILVFFIRDVNSKCTFAQKRYLFFLSQSIFTIITLPCSTLPFPSANR